MPGRLDPGEDNPVRAVDVFVEELDLAELQGVWWGRSRGNRPTSYHPSILLKLYIYGYLNRDQSTSWREYEAGAQRGGDVAIGSALPDHKTVPDFRKDKWRCHPQGLCSFYRTVPRDGPADASQRR